MTMISVLMLALVGCKTPADAEAESVEEPTETIGAAEPAPSADTSPEVVAADTAGFRPVKIPGTPHDEEGVSVSLSWAADAGEVGLVQSVGGPSKAVATAKFEKGGAIDYEDTIVLVTKGLLLTPTRDDVAITGASRYTPETGDFADDYGDEQVAESDEVWMLMYAGEGTCYMQLNERVYLANCPNDEFEPVDRKPEAFEWWVLVQGEGGSGWLKVDDRVKVDKKSSM